MDTNSIEVFTNNGQHVNCVEHDSSLDKPQIEFIGKDETKIEYLEIHELKSIW